MFQNLAKSNFDLEITNSFSQAKTRPNSNCLVRRKRITPICSGERKSLQIETNLDFCNQNLNFSPKI